MNFLAVYIPTYQYFRLEMLSYKFEIFRVCFPSAAFILQGLGALDEEHHHQNDANLQWHSEEKQQLEKTPAKKVLDFYE